MLLKLFEKFFRCFSTREMIDEAVPKPQPTIHPVVFDWRIVWRIISPSHRLSERLPEGGIEEKRSIITYRDVGIPRYFFVNPPSNAFWIAFSI